jgi:hypothetical protein
MKKINLKKEYEKECSTSSDINLHLPILYEAAKDCEHITEMGVRGGSSTRAFLYSNPKKYVAYDLYIDPIVNELFDYCKSIGKDYDYIESDVLNIEIEETDLLFIDTYHCYEQLSQELKLHSSKVKKYIAFHDTYTFGKVGEKLKSQAFQGSKGIMYAIEEFLEQNTEWEIVHDVDYNNGLIIVEKKS